MYWYDAIKVPIIAGFVGTFACLLARSLLPAISLAIVWDAVAVFAFVRLCKYTDVYTPARAAHIAFVAFGVTGMLAYFFITPGEGMLQLFGVLLLFFLEFYGMTVAVFLDK
jgi:hypothetical protein